MTIHKFNVRGERITPDTNEVIERTIEAENEQKAIAEYLLRQEACPPRRFPRFERHEIKAEVML